MKRTLLTIGLASSILGIFGCTCFEATPYWSISEIGITIADEGVSAEDSLIVNNALVIELIYGAQFIGGIHPKNNLLIPSTLALSCAEDGQEGMKDRIIKVEVFSREEYSHFRANDKINDIITTRDGRTLDEYVEDSGQWSYYSNGWIELIVHEASKNGDWHQFRIKVTTEEGNIYEKATTEFKWE